MREFFARFQRNRLLARGGILVLLVIALSRPRWGYEPQPVTKFAMVIWFCLDASRSMWTQDVPGNRLEYGRKILQESLDGLAGRPIGVVVFAAEARLLCPPTLDRDAIRQRINEITPATEVPGGSDLSSPLKLIAKIVNEAMPNGQQQETIHWVVLASDGGHQPITVETSNPIAQTRHLHVCAVGIGNADQPTPLLLPGSPIPVTHQGKAITTRLQEMPLRTLASATDGIYIQGNTTSLNLPELLDRQSRIIKGNHFSARSTPREQFQIFVLLAFFVAACDSVFVFRGQ